MIIKINELGDFLAGVFGPLTLFWLILGYLLQKDELVQSRKALQLQAKELHDTLQQQKEIVTNLKDQTKANIKATELQELQLNERVQPRFVITSVVKNEIAGDYDVPTGKVEKKRKFAHTVRFLNDGAPAANISVMVHFPERATTTYFRRDFLPPQEPLDISWEGRDHIIPNRVRIGINYYDTLDRKHTKTFYFRLTERFRYESTRWNYEENKS